MTRRIDLNADLGEGCGDDAAIMKIVTRCNIACGGHAGDRQSMAGALALAKANNVAAGAHPSYPDRENFGRTQMNLDEDALRRSLSEQVASLKALADEMDIPLQHVKPHGALYNHAAKDEREARVIAEVTAAMLPDGAMLGPPQSELEKAAKMAGITFLGEAFADRVYEAGGSLRSRSKPDALITTDEGCAAQALQIAMKRTVTTHGGEHIPMAARTICLHSDTPGALKAARRVRGVLEAEQFEVSADV